jgi:phage shock protein A
MEKVIYWMLGEKAGRTIVGTWNWLWGIPVESGGQVAVAVAEESLRSMQESVQKLAEAVATQVAGYQRAKQKYEEKVKELQLAESQATMAQRNSNEEAARLAMTRVLQIEKLLPQLEEQVKQAEQYVNASKEKLNRERQKLETYKTDMQNMKDMAEVNQALATMAKVNSDLNIDSARSQFESAKSAVERRNLQTSALVELSENPAEKLNAEMEKMTLDDQVARRLQMLGDSNSNQLPRE